MIRRPPRSTLFPSRRSSDLSSRAASRSFCTRHSPTFSRRTSSTRRARDWAARSEEHTSELQSQSNLVCRLLLEKKKKKLYHRLQYEIECYPALHRTAAVSSS